MQKEKMTLTTFFETLTKKYGKEKLVQRKCIEDGTKLVLVYIKDKAYIRPTKPTSEMSMEELRAACNSEKHIATYNKDTREGFIF